MKASTTTTDLGWKIGFARQADGALCVRLAGDWVIENELPSAARVCDEIDSNGATGSITFDTHGLVKWDSGLVSFLLNVLSECDNKGVATERGGLPDGVRRLLSLAMAVPEKDAGRDKTENKSVLAQVGAASIAAWDSAEQMLDFIGASTVAVINLVRGRARFRRSDLWLTIQECGVQALPIVSLISFLIGLILAFVGAVQLQLFGAGIFVANLVGIGMAREMGAMMTAIVMAGRTGAAFAAQLGTMTVNEEIDAFKTLGFSPMEYLVLPRMVALALMMPLLCLYADFVGMVGGAIVGIGMLDISLTQYLDQTRSAVSLVDLSVGLVKAVVFGVLVALSGCFRGMQCGRSSAAVGIAATSAVVTAIVLIIVTDAVFAVVTNMIGV